MPSAMTNWGCFMKPHEIWANEAESTVSKELMFNTFLTLRTGFRRVVGFLLSFTNLTNLLLFLANLLLFLLTNPSLFLLANPSLFLVLHHLYLHLHLHPHQIQRRAMLTKVYNLLLSTPPQPYLPASEFVMKMPDGGKS
ncbi:hypothetical protein K432DRAFT_412175 [Lepidopterella palustris CBS 459.81]|uniref:Uncharacterized protein n=1 Tax=Lepidopterella palustris CBS 459.81 TaxID=1314670 RepID=A0A8E2DW48_9PEZI|nr:hypothetical protein K432DRAFT_412175 [Lepidopterella palustris CBS 459.81]